MVRASTEAESESRFWESVVPSPALESAPGALRRRARTAAPREGRGRRGRHYSREPRPLGGDGGKGGGRHRRPCEQLRAGHLQPASRSRAQDERDGNAEYHRFRQAHAKTRAGARQHLLRRGKPLGRNLGERAPPRILPSQRGRGVRVQRRKGRSTTARGSPHGSETSPWTSRSPTVFASSRGSAFSRRDEIPATRKP